MKYSECCNAIIYDNTDICSDCLEHCDSCENEEGEWIMDIILYVIISVLIIVYYKLKETKWIKLINKAHGE